MITVKLPEQKARPRLFKPQLTAPEMISTIILASRKEEIITVVSELYQVIIDQRE